MNVLDIAYNIYEIFGDYTSALRFILFKDDAKVPLLDFLSQFMFL